MAEWIAALGALKHSIDIAKFLRESERFAQDAELKFKIAELYSQLSEIKMQMVDVQAEMKDKDDEIKKLKEGMRRRAELVLWKGYKYDKRANGKPVGFPYCPRCEEVDGLLIRTTSHQGLQVLSCPHCKAKYSWVTVFTYPDEMPPTEERAPEEPSFPDS